MNLLQKSGRNIQHLLRGFSVRLVLRLLVAVVLIVVNTVVRGQELVRNEDENSAQPDRLLLPFAFYNDTIGMAVGATYAGTGLIQPQSRFWSTAVAADSGTRFVFLGIEDLRTSRFDRLYFDVRFAAGDFSEIDVYVDGNPDFTNEVAGSNNSSPENFIKSEGTDSGFDVLFNYLLPIGYGRDKTAVDVILRDGLVVGGGRNPLVWNPLKSGLTSIGFQTVYRDQDTESDLGATKQTTAFLRLSLEHDNTDFKINPSRGSRQTFSISHDWGGFDSTDTWTAIALDLSKFISLGETRRARQRVLAFNAWLIDTPSWENEGPTVTGRPPSYAGASLGGLRRLKGYPEGRFNSRSAVYYATEYRYIPQWNQIANWSLLKRFNVDLDWIQFVGFAEVGRVSENFDLSELHEDMKWSGGVGIRAFANHLIVRAELATSDEDSIFVMSINQPF